MKRLLYFLIMLFVNSNVTLAQNPYRIKIVDKATRDNIEGAYVYINEVPSSDRHSDLYGVVSYNNLPRDRKVMINVKKDGYKFHSEEVLASPLATKDNFLLVELEKEVDPNKIVVFGNVENADDIDISHQKIVLSYMGRSIETTTDNFGNYRFEIEKTQFGPAKSFIIEIDVNGCEKFKTNEDYYGGNYINKNIKLKCHLSSQGNSYEISQPVQQSTPKTDRSRVNDTEDLLSGKWVGTLTQIGVAYKFSMVMDIRVIRGTISGTIQIFDERNQYINALFSVKGTYGKEIRISDITVAKCNGTRSWCLKEYVGEISSDHSPLEFSGSWNNDNYQAYDWGKIITIPTKCSGGDFILKKINN